jgi:hypothetical protein
MDWNRLIFTFKLIYKNTVVVRNACGLDVHAVRSMVNRYNE